jgi:uncharacterized membrane protein
MTATDTTVAQAQLIYDLTNAEIEVKSLSPEGQALLDARCLNVIENFLQGLLDKDIEAFHLKMIDDLVLGIQAYMSVPNTENKQALALIASSAQLKGVWKVCQQIKNSPAFRDLVALNTPDEDIDPKAGEYHNAEIITTGTTAAAIVAEVKPEKSESGKGGKGKPKTQQKLPMPAFASISELEALAKDRRGLIKAVQAVKSNNPDITLRANAATVELTKLLAKEVLGVEYNPAVKASKSKADAPKAAKGSNAIIKKEDIDLDTLTWEDCKNNMSYRQLQQVCGALKLKGLFTGNCGGKGATTENFMKGIADYFRSKGQTVVEAKMSPSNEIKPLKLPNLERALADRKAKEAVAA